MNARAQTVPKERKFWKIGFFALLLALNVLLAYRLIWGKQSLLSYYGLRSQYAELESAMRNLDEENAAISQEIRLLQQDDKYMEKMIRHRLNYVKDNEVLYLFNEGQKP